MDMSIDNSPMLHLYYVNMTSLTANEVYTRMNIERGSEFFFNTQIRYYNNGTNHFLLQFNRYDTVEDRPINDSNLYVYDLTDPT